MGQIDFKDEDDRGETKVLKAANGCLNAINRIIECIGSQQKITGVTTSTCKRLDTIPPSTGVASTWMTLVAYKAHRNSGIRNHVIPGGRSVWTVTMKFSPVKIELKPRMKLFDLLAPICELISPTTDRMFSLIA